MNDILRASYSKYGNHSTGTGAKKDNRYAVLDSLHKKGAILQREKWIHELKTTMQTLCVMVCPSESKVFYDDAKRYESFDHATHFVKEYYHQSGVLVYHLDKFCRAIKHLDDGKNSGHYIGPDVSDGPEAWSKGPGILRAWELIFPVIVEFARYNSVCFKEQAVYKSLEDVAMAARPSAGEIPRSLAIKGVPELNPNLVANPEIKINFSPADITFLANDMRWCLSVVRYESIEIEMKPVTKYGEKDTGKFVSDSSTGTGALAAQAGNIASSGLKAEEIVGPDYIIMLKVTALDTYFPGDEDDNT